MVVQALVVQLVLVDPPVVLCSVLPGAPSSRKSAGTSLRRASFPRRVIALHGQFLRTPADRILGIAPDLPSSASTPTSRAHEHSRTTIWAGNFARHRRRLRPTNSLDHRAQCADQECRRNEQIGYAAGYEPEAAFSRALKREFGRGPDEWRRGM
jgi:hypothetical protein